MTSRWRPAGLQRRAARLTSPYQRHQANTQFALRCLATVLGMALSLRVFAPATPPEFYVLPGFLMFFCGATAWYSWMSAQRVKPD